MKNSATPSDPKKLKILAKIANLPPEQRQRLMAFEAKRRGIKPETPPRKPMAAASTNPPAEAMPRSTSSPNPLTHYAAPTETVYDGKGPRPPGTYQPPATYPRGETSDCPASSTVPSDSSELGSANTR